jgi:hypothetical protein
VFFVTKSQHELCLEILRRFNKAGVLGDLILIGSWSVLFYEEYFGDRRASVTLRTRDMDFLVAQPERMRGEADVPGLLKDLGFVSEFFTSSGHIRLLHPDLIVEFLVPEVGRGRKNPFPLRKLKINAQPLRFLNLLTTDVIRARVDDFVVTLPHPVNFTLQKLIISERRSKSEKASRDRETALRLLAALAEQGEGPLVVERFGSLPPRWRKTAVKALATGIAEFPEYYDLANMLS